MLKYQKEPITVPPRTIIPWMKYRKIFYVTTYGTYFFSGTAQYRVGIHFTGQNLINLGYAEGADFPINVIARHVNRTGGLSVTTKFSVYSNPNTTTVNGVITSGDLLYESALLGTGWAELSSTISDTWTSTTDFVACYQTRDLGSEDGYSQFKHLEIGRKELELPSNYLECDGSVISDSESPYNGETLPNLNGNNRFLRGADSGNATGGSETHRHSFVFTTQDDSSSSGGTSSTPGYPVYNTTYYTNYSENLPPYENIVWIMRIK